MKSLLWLPLTTLLVFGCHEAADEATAPSKDVPNRASEVNLDDMAANVLTQAGLAARCVQLRYVSETGVTSNLQRGPSCTCSPGRLVSVTAVIWNGAGGNNNLGRAFCGAAGFAVAGPASAVDPTIGVFGVTSIFGQQLSGAPGCTINWTSQQRA